MNRYFRRLQQFGKRFSARRSHGEMPELKREPPIDPRAKSSGHDKKTADKLESVTDRLAPLPVRLRDRRPFLPLLRP
jgi:hypothetical protein